MNNTNISVSKQNNTKFSLKYNQFNQIDNIRVISQNKLDNMKILDIKNNKIDKKKNKELIADIKKNIKYKLLI